MGDPLVFITATGTTALIWIDVHGPFTDDLFASLFAGELLWKKKHETWTVVVTSFDSIPADLEGLCTIHGIAVDHLHLDSARVGVVSIEEWGCAPQIHGWMLVRTSSSSALPRVAISPLLLGIAAVAHPCTIFSFRAHVR